MGILEALVVWRKGKILVFSISQEEIQFF